MSLLAIKPFNYPIAINVEVTKCSQINDTHNWSFDIQFTSNVTTWEITHTLSEFEQLHSKLRDCKTLRSIKLPRTLTQTPPSEFKESGKQIIEDYLWKLLRRAYIFTSKPLQIFIQLPIIMEQKTNYMCKQLNIIIRENIILYSIQNDNKYIPIQCILRSSYIFDAYKKSNNNDDYLRNELNEGFNDINKLLFRIDVVQIKRVLKYQKEYKFAIESRKGTMYAFKCKNKMQFNEWLNDIKNMIKAQGGCTPYLSRWENNGIEYDEIDKVSPEMNMYDDDSLDLFDFENTRGPLSTISEKTGLTSLSDEKHEYMDEIDMVDLDIKSVIDENNNSDQGSNDTDDVSIELTIYSTEEEDDDDDDYNKIFDEIKSVQNDDNILFTDTVQSKYIANCNGHSSENESGSDNDEEHTACTQDTMTLKMQAKELEKPRRKSDTEMQISRMVRDQRERFGNNIMDIIEVNDEVNEDENIGSQSVMKYGAIITPNNMNDNIIINDESERDDEKDTFSDNNINGGTPSSNISMITPNTPPQVISTITPFNAQELGNYNNESSQSSDKKDIFNNNVVDVWDNNNNNSMNDNGIIHDKIDTFDANNNVHISDISTNGNKMDYGAVNVNDKPIINDSDNKMNENMNVNLSCDYGVTKHNYIAYKRNKNICNIREHRNMNHMIDIEEYNLLKEQMFLWQSKANRWEAMANKFERHTQQMELKLRGKEGKYKHKIKDQSNEILTLTKLYNCAQIDLENKIIELKQLESASNIAIQQLIGYKNKNEMRKKNSYIDGTLWKFTGDEMNNIKFNKAPRLKYVMYVPTKRKLYYSDSQRDDADTKLVNVTHISHRNEDLMTSLPNKYKNIWIKIIGQNRIVLFVAKNEEDADRWYDTIINSLQQYNNDD